MAKIQTPVKIEKQSTYGTGIALTCTGTGSVLKGCTGTGLGYTSTVSLLHHLYRYSFKGVPVQVPKFAHKW